MMVVVTDKWSNRYSILDAIFAVHLVALCEQIFHSYFILSPPILPICFAVAPASADLCYACMLYPFVYSYEPVLQKANTLYCIEPFSSLIRYFFRAVD